MVELEAFSILDPSKVPEESANGFAAYENNRLDCLCCRYGTGDKADICKEGLRSEWVTFKTPAVSEVPSN